MIRNILEVAKKGILSYKSAVDIVSRNISGASVEGYTRQTPILSANGEPNLGVIFENAKRERLEIMERVIRDEIQNFKSLESQNSSVSIIESLFSEPQGGGILRELNDFFNSLKDFATSPDSFGIRQTVVLKAEALAQRIRIISQRIVEEREMLNKQIPGVLDEINQDLKRIAELNKKISEVSAMGGNANELKDQRDLLIRKLSEKIGIKVFEDEKGMVSVYLKNGGQVLVSKDSAVELKASEDINNFLNPITHQGFLYAIRYVGRGTQMNITPFIEGGILGGVLKIRDTFLQDVLSRINFIAQKIIEIFGNINAKGVGIEHFSEIVSNFSVSDQTLPLNSLDLPFEVSGGKITITIYSSTGTPLRQIVVNYDPAVDSIADILNMINTSSDNGGIVSATFEGGKVKISSSPDFLFDIQDDGGLLTALGIKNLFLGKNAFDIDIDKTFFDNPFLLSASSLPFSPTLGDIAEELASIKDKKIEGEKTLLDFYFSLQNSIGNVSSLVSKELSQSDLVLKSLENEIQQRAGVSVDEEIMKMMEFQRAYEASARIVRISDEMILAILNLVGG